ncbi:hypothetical protein N752_21785 [Desulforamulus aquiferis]|nr:DUF6385 domain-containing protein [Desulforamulus aquiferis]RYD03045.1 hypothetical protein N752_21785 [Desulforamulus aquiferis]
MPNFTVFNFDPDVLRTKIFGSMDVAIATDADGRLEIAGISDSITVTAADLDIRDLCADNDNVLVFGFDGSDVQPIRTDDEGRLEVISNITPTYTEDEEAAVTTDDDFTGLAYVDTSTQVMYTYFVYNTGANSADVRLDVSPTGEDEVFYIDVAARTLASGATDTFVAKTFLRYTRLSYRSTAPTEPTTLDIYFQSQSN